MESEARYRELVENANDPIFTADTHGNLTFLNRKAEVLIGRSRDEVIGESFVPFIPTEADRQQVLNLFQEVLKQGTSISTTLTFNLNRSNRDTAIFEINARPITEGEVTVGIEGIVRDITKWIVLEHRLKSVNRFIRALNQTTEVEKLMQVILEEAIAMIPGADSGSFLMLNEAKGIFEFKATIGWNLELLQQIKIPADLTFLSREGIQVPTIVDDIRAHDHRLGEEIAVLFDRVGYPKSSIVIPLLEDGQVTGYFFVDSKGKADAFNIEDLKQVEEVIDQIWLMIKRARDRKELEVHKEKLRNLHVIGQQLAEIDRLETILEEMLEQLKQDFDYTVGTILLMDEDDLRIERLVYTDEKLLGRQSRGVGERVKIGEGITGWVAQHQAPALVNDVTQDSRYIGSEHMRSELAVPIKTDKQLLGVLNIESARVRAFDETDLELLTAVAGQMALAISSLKKRESIREQAIRDSLTGSYNRRYFNEVIEKELLRSDRYGHSVSFLMIDIDRFKRINDELGHQVGDWVLQEVARILEHTVRDSDIVVRYGGDEFLVMMTETQEADARNLIDRLRDRIKWWNRQDSRRDRLDFELTLSTGLSSWSSTVNRKLNEVLKEADDRMYEDKAAKGKGKGRER